MNKYLEKIALVLGAIGGFAGSNRDDKIGGSLLGGVIAGEATRHATYNSLRGAAMHSPLLRRIIVPVSYSAELGGVY